MNLAWYARRLSRMSPAEVTGRLSDAWLKRRWQRRQVRPGEADPLAVPDSVPPFATPLRDFDATQVSDATRTRLLGAADAALAGRFPFFDRERDDLGEDPDWFYDPRTNRRAPEEAYAFDIDHRNVDKVGTIKYVWEPSRHYQLTLLSTAYFITGDDRYAEFVAAQLQSWWRRNPFLSGVHWTSGIEIGVRLISWAWVRRLLDGWPGVKPLFDENPAFLQQLHHHQEYLAHLPSHGSSANNHILAEEAGQFVACCVFPYFAETAAWRERSADALREETLKQTFGSGLNRELATSYHVFVLELILAAAIEGEAIGHSLGTEFWHCICRMTDALAAVVDVKGRPPRQGDGDMARGVLLDAPEADAIPSILATGARLFGARSWWPDHDPDDLRALLWGALIKSRVPSGPRPATRPALFADAGMAILRDRADTEDEIWCRCDHGPHGYLSIAAHAHADALSVELRCGGVDLLADPGTYTYQGEETWRAYFRSTLAHNCLQVDGQDQSVSGGPFLWLRATDGSLVAANGLEEGPVAEWSAMHDGYKRLSPGARHRRDVRLIRDAGRIVITDTVECAGRHEGCLAFHLGPDVDCYLDGGVAQLSWQAGERRRRATMHLPATLDWVAVRGQANPPLGWYSPCFGAKTPSTTLIGRGAVGNGERITTELRIDLRNRDKAADDIDSVSATGAPEDD
ncbi:MAG: heparinase II/III family protein [Alphaproteobacteria bacterium]|nr:heparinase II/III family protein [Alphaproteobacteria bacterium]